MNFIENDPPNSNGIEVDKVSHEEKMVVRTHHTTNVRGDNMEEQPNSNRDNSQHHLNAAIKEGGSPSQEMKKRFSNASSIGDKF